MKMLTIVIPSAAQQAFADTLRSLSQVQNFIFCHVEGHSHQSEDDPFLSSRDKVVGYVPRVRVEVLISGDDIETVLSTFAEKNNLNGQGHYWVTAVEQQGKM